MTRLSKTPTEDLPVLTLDKKEIDPRHHYRWNSFFGMWIHTGLIYYKDGTPL